MELTKEQEKYIVQNLDFVNTEDLYGEYLDEVFGDVKIAGYDYATSDALKELDPTAFRCGILDYIDSLLGDTLLEIDDEYYLRDDVEALLEEMETA